MFDLYRYQQTLKRLHDLLESGKHDTAITTIKTELHAIQLWLQSED